MDEADRHRLTPEQHERIFQRDIVPDLTAHTRAARDPSAVILGGQPGAGKSALQSLVEREFTGAGGVLAIIGDDLRAYHPKYQALLRRDDKRAAFFTDRDSALWIEKLIEHAKTRRFNLLIESTMRVSTKIASTAASLREAGYRVEARALAVHEHWSLLGIHQRYEEMLTVHGRGRFTLKEVHDAAYAGMLQTIGELESSRLVDRLVIYTRGNVVLYDHTCRPTSWIQEPAARERVEAERSRRWLATEKVEFLRGWQHVLDARKRRRAGREDVAMAREWRDRALLEVHRDPTARPELARKLTSAQQEALTRLAAAAAFERLPKDEAVSLFPALSPYFAVRARLGKAVVTQLAELSAQIARMYPKPPARARSRDRGR